MSINNEYNSQPIPSREELEKNKIYYSENKASSKTVDKFNYDPFIEIKIGQTGTNIDNISELQADANNVVRTTADTIITNKANISLATIDEPLDISRSESSCNIEIIPQHEDSCHIEAIPQTEAVIHPVDDKRALFYKMHIIGRNNMSFNHDTSKAFYYQGLFMKDFEDDYDVQEPFSSYYPYYDLMNYEQLRTYFTWRTQARKGIVENISLSYAFLYIYELINNIGVTDPDDGLNKLMTFWRAFREYDSTIDRYVLNWIKDYHIYYPLQKPFKEFASENNLQMYYPTIFGYNSDKEISFDLYSTISKYNIKKSAFYSEQTQKMIKNCFYYILYKLREAFKKQDKCFEDLIFYPLKSISSWEPFSSALFYQENRQLNRQVVISEREKYSCSYSRWLYKSVILSEAGKQLIGYIIKEMESSLRSIVKYKYKLTANVDMCDKSTRKELKSMGIVFPQFIQQLVSEFYTLSTRKKITVDTGNLNQIRREAFEIQEKLIVPEDDATKGAKDTHHCAAGTTQNEKNTVLYVNEKPLTEKSTPSIEDKTATEIKALYDVSDKSIEQSKYSILNKPENTVNPIEQSKPVINLPTADTDPWNEFKLSLTQTELEALQIILDEKDIKKFAIQNMIMLEVLIDEINKKAMDCIGDTIMELDDTVTIYDDYRAILIGMVK